MRKILATPQIAGVGGWVMVGGRGKAGVGDNVFDFCHIEVEVPTRVCMVSLELLGRLRVEMCQRSSNMRFLKLSRILSSLVK